MSSNSESPNNCHICGKLSEFVCEKCGQPACEDCLVPFTLQNQIDYCLCNYCHDSSENSRLLDALEEAEWMEKQNAQKVELAVKRRANYWKPENIEKRRLKKIQLKKDREEADRKRIEEVASVMKDFMRFF